MFARRLSPHRVRFVLGAAVLAGLAAIAAPPASGAAPPAPAEDAVWPDGLPGVVDDFQRFIAALQAALDQLTAWTRLFRESAADILGRMIWESPGLFPDEADVAGLIRQIEALPAALRGELEAVRAKLQAPFAAGSIGERHHAYIESNPALIHEAIGIAETDQVVAGGTVRHAVATQATAAAAAAASQDLRSATGSAAAREAADALGAAGQNLPSSRAGIEVLIAGVGATLRQQADLGGATADRLTLLIQQMAQVSQQLEAVGATVGAWTLRQGERDRRALDSQLGIADAATGVAQLLQEVLVDAGNPPADEPALAPLY